MKKVLAAVVGVSLLAGQSLADDHVLMADPVVGLAPAYDWSGFYLGVFGGYGMGRGTSTGVPSGTVDTFTLSGGLLGALAGYNVQLGQFVLGLEGDVAWSGIAGGAPCALLPTSTCGGTVNWLGTVRGRAGVALDGALLYVTAGIAAAGASASVTPPAPGSTGTFADTLVGYTVGGGAEVFVADNVSLKAEYAYVDLGPRQAPVGTLGAANAYDVKVVSHTAKVGANFHF